MKEAEELVNNLLVHFKTRYNLTDEDAEWLLKKLVEERSKA